MDVSNIPIIVYIGNLEKWLIGRQDVNKDWQENIITIKEKINNAMQDIPAHDSIADLSVSSINYFDCFKILEILNETEVQTDSLLGKEESQRIKVWHDIVKCYEKDNIYLAEAAHTIVRNIFSVLPSLEEQIPKEEKRELECETKYAEYLNGSESCKSDFLDLCELLGIKGDKIKRELVERLQELPDIYHKISNYLKPIQPSIELYYEFNKYVLREQAIERLPLLKYVVENGNTTVYEWTYGEPPLSIEPDPLPIALEDEQGCISNEKIGSGDINKDFGADAPEEINCSDGNIETKSSDLPELSVEGAAAGQQSAPGVARGQDALRLLDHTHTRDMIINQLLELESFLANRIYDLNNNNTCEKRFYLEEKPPTVSEEALDEMLETVKIASSALTTPEITHLHKVKNSPGYLDELTAYVQKKLDRCNRQSLLVSREAERRAAARARAEELRREHARLLRRTGELQAQWANKISEKNKGRPVKIIDGLKV